MTDFPLWLNLSVIAFCMVMGGAVSGGPAGARVRYPKRKISVGFGLLIPPIGLLVVLMLINYSLVFRPSLSWYFPLWLEYRYPILLWGSIMALFSFLFGIAAGRAIRTGHRRRWVLIVSGIAFIQVFQWGQWSCYQSVASVLTERISSQGVIMQTSPSSGTAASGANLLKAYGVLRTEKDMAVLFGTSRLGTTAARIVRGMRQFGFYCEKKENTESRPEGLRPPAFMFIDDNNSPNARAVVYMGLRGEKAEIWDPRMGIRRLGREELKSVWRGRAIECVQD